MSPNLRKALGLTTHAESATQGATGEAMGSDWRPPTFSGLDNSEPLTYLKPLAVGQRKGLEVRQAGSGSADGEESDEEGWDFEGALSCLYVAYKTNSMRVLCSYITTEYSHNGETKEECDISHDIDLRPVFTTRNSL